MTEELSDLPVEAVLYAIDRWAKGDSSHLSSFQQAGARIGSFFPQPAELRQIASLHLRHEREVREERERQEAEKQETRHRIKHPEDYVSMGDILKGVAERGRTKKLQLQSREAHVKPSVCQECAGRVLASFTAADLRRLADLKDAQQECKLAPPVAEAGT